MQQLIYDIKEIIDNIKIALQKVKIVTELSKFIIKVEKHIEYVYIDVNEIDKIKNLSDVYKNFIINTLEMNITSYEELKYLLQKILKTLTDMYLIFNETTDSLVDINVDKYLKRLRYSLHKLYEAVDLLDNQKRVLSIAKFSDKNVVILGKNGSGKTSLARKLQNMSKNAQYVLIPAVRILELSEKSIRQNNGNIHNIDTFSFNFNSNIGAKNINYVEYSFMNALSVLRETHRDGICNDSSLLYKLQQTWSDLFPNRTIDISGQVFNILNREEKQDINTLSDGEKMALFIIAIVLLAKPKSYIVIDEPENNINIAILNELYDRVEALRDDCVFIYITHSLDLAVGRYDATKLWMKRFDHKAGQPIFEEIKIDDTIIPEELYIELLGYKKPLLFCEGTKSSIDYQLFNIIFKDYVIVPVGNCDEVIKALNVTRTCSQLNISAIAIIDRDFRDNEELQRLQCNGVYHYDFYKIENLLCAPEILEFVLKKQLLAGEQIQIGKDKLCEVFKSNYDNFKNKFEKFKFQNGIKSIINSNKTTDDIKQEINFFISGSMVLDFPDSNASYEDILRFYPDKKLIPYGKEADKDKIIKTIRANKDLQQIIRDTYFSIVPKL